VRPETRRPLPAAAPARRREPVVLLALCVTLVAATERGAPAAADRTPQRQVEERLMCYCGCSDLTVRVCSCGTADAIRQEITDRLSRGETADDVVARFVARYGAQIRSAPTKSAVDLVAWITPFAVLLLSGAALVVIVRRWGSPRPAPAGPPSGAPTVDPGRPLGPGDQKALDRVRRELREEG